ncbi:uncharacterized protein [Physcomitrium patens]|uniref:RING-type domain-containing protein n=1 Tax=Physcomitrium patens TaxID=3218 RepID=A0A2K1KW86_PHYPA|nr:uncharacterized protein LOC112280113 isoform X1 [Physcomitrium patens]PNR58041.1 hypothetical protein PHYPA_005036 [Physcomitrium patens]|eukprot:XP_024370951.1 uncharacterized protein LOC112280113 isoform X1 [Physcomitrella patens]
MAGSAAGAQVGESCSICLESVTGEAFLDQCFHRFCYHCILQWSEMVMAASLAKTGDPKRVTPLECPLCKTHYTSIIHDLVAGTKFQRHFLLAPDGSQFRLSEAHRRRLAVYAALKAGASSKTVLNSSTLADLDAGVGSPLQGTKTRTISGVVKANKWLPCWVQRELQALMQDEDVNMVTHHVVGVVQSLQKRSRGTMFRPDSGSAKEPSSKSWCNAVAEAMRSFIFEDAEMFAVELWKFLDSGIDIAFYDQHLSDCAVTAVADENQGPSTVATAENARSELLDEDVEVR